MARKPKTQKQEGTPVGALELAVQAARIARGDNAENVVVLDLRELSSIADYFVIATATSDRQMRAIADHVEGFARSVGEKPYRTSGYESSSWLLADYIDVVIHLFSPEKRGYYELDILWGDAPRVKWEDPKAL
ncbi:MAG TPA: ribosome silencing factor [Phycisphaerae bacterium]|nr:ribosome silencing factor [Phycisphaerae bacterium]HRY71079.1 ribosome silencing factor [Phycisphaerae bacterium]HSA29746.1 ribosome silencing factor [Phycisphaerae bacterium]